MPKKYEATIGELFSQLKANAHNDVGSIQDKNMCKKSHAEKGNTGDDVKKAEAVMGFVNMMVGAFEAGFIDDRSPTLAQVYQIARNHVKDNFNYEAGSLESEWGAYIYKALSAKTENNSNN